MIGLSPLTTSHPKTFQRQLVRSSNKCYLIFNLLMARSLGFGFNPKYCRPIKTRFRYAYTLRLKLALQTNSLTHYTKGTPSPLRASTACKHSISGSISLPSSGFFSPFPHGTSSLSVTQEYLGLEGGPPIFRQDFTCPVLLENINCHYPYETITLYGLPFQVILVVQLMLLAWSAFARHYLRSIG